MIDRYQCFTGHDPINHYATLTDDGPWVSYEDHVREAAYLRDQVIRRDEEISDLRHEVESAQDAARGENALRLEVDRERDTLRANLERWVKEVAHLKLAAEKAERKGSSGVTS